MIKNRNLGDYVMEFVISGAQTASTITSAGRTSAIVPFDSRLSAIIARLATAGVTGSQTTDVQVNGVSINSSGTLLSFATTSKIPTYATTTLLTNPTKVNKGDVITLQNTAVHTTAANDLTAYITLERQRSGSFADTMATETIDVG